MYKFNFLTIAPSRGCLSIIPNFYYILCGRKTHEDLLQNEILRWNYLWYFTINEIIKTFNNKIAILQWEISFESGLICDHGYFIVCRCISQTLYEYKKRRGSCSTFAAFSDLGYGWNRLFKLACFLFTAISFFILCSSAINKPQW